MKRTPHLPAVIFEGKELSYKELNEKANQLACFLKENYEIRPDTQVAVCLEPREQMVIAMLGILKAGGAYVTIDPAYPDSRIEYILSDSNSKVVITNEWHRQRLELISGVRSSHKIQVLKIDHDILQKVVSSQSKDNLKQDSTSSHLAYVIYTSGTTGNPKGVMIEHRGVVSLVKNVDYYGSILVIHLFSFRISLLTRLLLKSGLLY